MATASPALQLDGCQARLFETSDTALLARTIQANRDTIGRWLGWAHEAYGLEDAAGFIQLSSEQRSRGEAWEFGLFSDDGRELLGSAGLNRIDGADRSANLGYWVATARTGRGLATAAARAVARFGFQALDLVRIEIVAAEHNTASRRVAEKLGAQLECMARNRVLLAGSPQPGRGLFAASGRSRLSPPALKSPVADSPTAATRRNFCGRPAVTRRCARSGHRARLLRPARRGLWFRVHEAAAPAVAQR